MNFSETLTYLMVFVVQSNVKGTFPDISNPEHSNGIFSLSFWHFPEPRDDVIWRIKLTRKWTMWAADVDRWCSAFIFASLVTFTYRAEDYVLPPLFSRRAMFSPFRQDKISKQSQNNKLRFSNLTCGLSSNAWMPVVHKVQIISLCFVLNNLTFSSAFSSLIRISGDHWRLTPTSPGVMAGV